MCKTRVIIIVTIMFLIVFLSLGTETFVNKSDKANSIYSWFVSQKNPTYTEYKQNFENDSNIVEYEDILRLYRNNKLSLEGVSGVL